MLSRLHSMALAGIVAKGLPTVRLSAQFKKAFDSMSVQAPFRGRLGFPAGLLAWVMWPQAAERQGIEEILQRRCFVMET